MEGEEDGGWRMEEDERWMKDGEGKEGKGKGNVFWRVRFREKRLTSAAAYPAHRLTSRGSPHAAARLVAYPSDSSCCVVWRPLGGCVPWLLSRREMAHSMLQLYIYNQRLL